MVNIKKKNSNKVDYITIGIFSAVILFIALIMFFNNYYVNNYMNIIQTNIEQRLIADCRVLKSYVTAEQLESYQVIEDMNRADYKELLSKLQKYTSDNDLEFAYFIRRVGTKVQYIVDSDPNPDERLGLDYFEDAYWLMDEAYSKKEPVVDLIGHYDEKWEGLLSAYAPIFNDSGEIVALVGVDIRDEEIVSRRKISEALTYVSATSVLALGITGIMFVTRYRKKARIASESSIAKSQFLSRMSHEIRTPMNAIIGFCRMAKKTEDTVKRVQYLDSISTSSDYLLELINAILDISKIEAGKMTLDLQKVSLNKSIREVEAILVSQLMKKSHNLEISIATDIPEYVYCDKTRLTQVIVNLTANAIKFTPDEGKIEIKVSVIEKKDKTCNLEFIVKDNGIGIEPETIKKLFEPFEQGDGSITRKYGGTGLGLTISKHFIEMMQGSISISSKVGEGSAFRFNVHLDIVEPKDYPTKEENSTEIKLDCTGMNFLIAEDSEVNQIIAKDVFEGFNANLEFVNDGAECVEKFNSNPEKYDIIFMDIQMPNMDGLEATKKIRASDIEYAKKIPIIAMTANVFQEDINNTINAGMNEHIGKPLDINVIASVIKEIIKDK